MKEAKPTYTLHPTNKECVNRSENPKEEAHPQHGKVKSRGTNNVFAKIYTR